MDMQDKELDEIFRSKLDNLEMQPSASVWGNIDHELNKGKFQKRIIPFLSIAASVIILAAAGILLVPKQQKPATKQLAQNSAAKITLPVNKLMNNPVVPGTMIKSSNPGSSLAIAKSMNRIALLPLKEPKPIAAKRPIAIVDTTTANKGNRQPMLIASEQPKPAMTNAVVPDDDTHLIIVEPVKDNSSFMTKPVIPDPELPVAGAHYTTPVKKKHNIKSLGDLINVVVAKVDKRKDKFIEFSDTDGDEATITGVNIGIIRIKKDK